MKKSVLEINKTNGILFIKHQIQFHSRTTKINDLAHKNYINIDKCSKNFILFSKKFKISRKILQKQINGFFI